MFYVMDNLGNGWSDWSLGPKLIFRVAKLIYCLCWLLQSTQDSENCIYNALIETEFALDNCLSTNVKTLKLEQPC